MPFRFLVCIQVVLMASLATPISHAFAQREDLAISEQPGLVPESQNPPPEFQRAVVSYRTSEIAGTIIVHTSERFLYVIQPGGRALRYGIGVGRDGFQWQGLQKISRKQEWPDWTPPPEMIERQPYLPRFMAGGPGNPMGARALYLGGPSTASMAPTSRTRSEAPSRPGASASLTTTSLTFMNVFQSAPR